MNSIFKWFTLILVISVSGVLGTTYHVYPAGTNLKKNKQIGITATNLAKIIMVLNPGDTVYMRGGTHFYKKTIVFNRSGTPKAKIHVLAYPGESPIFDFTGNTGPGMVLDATHTAYTGQTFQNAADNGLLITGSNNTITRCNFIGNGDSGLQIEGSNNTITDCDSYYNEDASQANADGFAPKLGVGSGNKFIGCRAWQNSDDGWDGYLKESKDVSQSLENCWSFRNGILKDGSISAGNGNGFKPGSSIGTQNWTLTNCFAYGNTNKGFDQNHNLGSITLYNCTSVNNTRYNYVEYEQPASGKTAIYKNCLSFNTAGGAGLDIGTFVQVTKCSWSGFTITAADFESVDPGSELPAARKSDGSLPDIKFMHLKQGSSLIDAGVDVGIAYQGKAPDIGAFESSYTSKVEYKPALYSSDLDWHVFSNGEHAAIEFILPNPQLIIIAVFELSGKKVVTALSTRAHQGRNVQILDLKNITSGLYICSLEYNGLAFIKKLVKKT